MTPSNQIPPILTDRESEDLELHVRVCAERYSKLSDRMDSLEEKFESITDSIEKFRSDIFKVSIGTAGTVITAVIGGIVAIYSK